MMILWVSLSWRASLLTQQTNPCSLNPIILLTTMSSASEQNPTQNEPGPPVNLANSAANELTTKEIESWDEEKLLQWIDDELPRPLKPEDRDCFIKAEIDGYVFVHHGSNRNTYTEAGLSAGISYKLADLAMKTI